MICKYHKIIWLIIYVSQEYYNRKNYVTITFLEYK